VLTSTEQPGERWRKGNHREQKNTVGARQMRQTHQ
jgi:hypothetical protein